MKGIILSGGKGTRLYPLTKGVSKQLLPIYDKPMIYYPLSVLMLSDIKEILIITTEEDQFQYKQILSDGSRFGINIQYEIQKKPNGLAEAFLIGEKFIGDDNVSLILGDNVFYGQGFGPILQAATKLETGAIIFSYPVRNPNQFGVVQFNEEGYATSIEEKPEFPKSNHAVTGLYFYDNEVVQIAKNIKPSERGELEITSINQQYLETKNLKVVQLGRGFAWVDTGSCESLLEASQFIEIIEKRQGYKIACLEEIAFSKGWISKNQMLEYANEFGENNYGSYLRSIAEENS